MSLLPFLFWSCFALVAYAYAGYPLVIWACSRLFGRGRGQEEVGRGREAVGRQEAVGKGREAGGSRQEADGHKAGRSPLTTHHSPLTTHHSPLTTHHSAELPTISLLIAAHNEEAVIGARLENALALDYPPGKLEIVVASDGSSDRTAEIVREVAARVSGGVVSGDARAVGSGQWAVGSGQERGEGGEASYSSNEAEASPPHSSLPHSSLPHHSPLTTHHSPAVRLLDYQPNRGKAATLNAAWGELTGEIVLLSDANTFTDAAAPRMLVRWFRDPAIGAVCGKLVLVDPATGRNVDGLYWRYETFLKLCEARLGALLGANGAIYAIRREVFVPIPSETIVDDFVIPLLAKLKHGCRLVYEAEAVAREETPPAMADEFKRRARIGAGGFQSLGILWPLLSPRYGWLAFSFLSHKLLRWCSPFFLLGMIAANLALLEAPLYRWTLAAQAGFYLVAWVGSRLPGSGAFSRAIRLTTLFSSMNAALLVGFWRWATGRQRGAWSRTARE